MQYMTISDTARLTGISRQTVYHHIRRGNIKTTKVGPFQVVPADEVSRFKSRLARIPVGSNGRVIAVYLDGPQLELEQEDEI